MKTWRQNSGNDRPYKPWSELELKAQVSLVKQAYTGKADAVRTSPAELQQPEGQQLTDWHQDNYINGEHINLRLQSDEGVNRMCAVLRSGTSWSWRVSAAHMARKHRLDCVPGLPLLITLCLS